MVGWLVHEIVVLNATFAQAIEASIGDQNSSFDLYDDIVVTRILGSKIN